MLNLLSNEYESICYLSDEILSPWLHPIAFFRIYFALIICSAVTWNSFSDFCSKKTFVTILKIRLSMELNFQHFARSELEVIHMGSIIGKCILGSTDNSDGCYVDCGPLL